MVFLCNLPILAAGSGFLPLKKLVGMHTHSSSTVRNLLAMFSYVQNYLQVSGTLKLLRSIY